MRLWHIDLIKYLPNTQLIAQWRELNSIFKYQPKHILINYVYKYEKQPLLNYTLEVIREMTRRNINIKSFVNFYNYFDKARIELDVCSDLKCSISMFNHTGLERFYEHNDEYLTICYYNLKEKYLRGQRDFSNHIWNKLNSFYKDYIRNK